MQISLAFIYSIARILLLSLLLSSCATHQQVNDNAVETVRTAKPHYILVKGGKIEYYRFGQGSPILLMPGYLTDVTSWDSRLLTALSKSHDVIAINYRNVGGSKVNGAHYTSKELASDAHQLLQGLRIKKSAVLGISMGGMIAQQYTAMYPHSVSKLILINTAVAGRHSVHPDKKTESKMLNMPISKVKRYIIALNLFFPASKRLQMSYAVAINHFHPTSYTEIDVASVIVQQREVILGWAKDDAAAKQLQQLPVPVLIINGESDQVIPPVNSEILKNTFKHAKLVRWQDGGHAIIYQYPDEIVTEIDRF